MRLLNRLQNLRNAREPEREEKASRPLINTTDAHAILRLERRQHIIEFLAKREVGEEVTTGEIADYMESLGDQRDACFVSLCQSHLPRMERSQFIEYIQEEQLVRPTETLYRLYEAHEAFEAALG